MPPTTASAAELASQVLQLAGQIAHAGQLPPAAVTRNARPLAPDLAALPPARVRDDLQRLITAPQVDLALQWLHDAGALAVLLPELEATVDFTQEAGRRHKDVWKHTKQVLRQAAARPVVRWAALLHDIGKVPTREFRPGGKVTFHGHPEAGARMLDAIARRLAFPAELRARVRFLVLHHLRANQYDGTWTDSAVRRFDGEMGEHLEDLLDLSRADITSARPQKREQALVQIEELVGRIYALREADSRVPPLPSGIGHHLMERFALPPGPLIGKIKQRLEEAIAQDRLQPHQEVGYYLDFIEAQGGVVGVLGQAPPA